MILKGPFQLGVFYDSKEATPAANSAELQAFLEVFLPLSRLDWSRAAQSMMPCSVTHYKQPREPSQ